MNKTTTVTVTKKHLTAANKADAEGKEPRSKVCVVAQALMDVFPEADISVRFTTAYVVEKDDTALTFNLSNTGVNLISKYDNHALKAKDLPITFRMTLAETKAATAGKTA